jgi:hypothetical protein
MGAPRKARKACFLDKRSKKTRVRRASAMPGKAQRSSQKFFGSFFSKKNRFLPLALPRAWAPKFDTAWHEAASKARLTRVFQQECAADVHCVHFSWPG